MPGSILLVIPAYRESRRLPGFLPELCEAIEAAALPADVLIVDDGSGSDERTRMQEFLDDERAHHRSLRPLHSLASNVGKGGAVYFGWDLAGDHEWLAFVDADGSVPAREVVRLLAMTARPALAGQAIYAIRVSGAGRKVERVPGRRFTGQVFRWLVRVLFRLPVPDTQCGFKIVPAAAYRRLRGQLVEKRFCFDVELTGRLLGGGIKIFCEPIDWHESPGGHVHLRTVWEMLASLLRLRRRLNIT